MPGRRHQLERQKTISLVLKTQNLHLNMHTAGLLFIVVLGNRTSKSLFPGFVDDEDVETQSLRYEFVLAQYWSLLCFPLTRLHLTSIAND